MTAIQGTRGISPATNGHQRMERPAIAGPVPVKRPVKGRASGKPIGAQPIHEPVRPRRPRTTPGRPAVPGGERVHVRPKPTQLGEKRVTSPIAPVHDALRAVRDVLRPVVEVAAWPIERAAELVERVVELVEERPDLLYMQGSRSSGKR